MRDILEMLWNECLFDKCAAIETDNERNHTKRVGELYKTMEVLLDNEQMDAVEKYTEALYDAEAIFIKKAFFIY